MRKRFPLNGPFLRNSWGDGDLDSSLAVERRCEQGSARALRRIPHPSGFPVVFRTDGSGEQSGASLVQESPGLCDAYEENLEKSAPGAVAAMLSTNGKGPSVRKTSPHASPQGAESSPADTTTPVCQAGSSAESQVLVSSASLLLPLIGGNAESRESARVDQSTSYGFPSCASTRGFPRVAFGAVPVRVVGDPARSVKACRKADSSGKQTDTSETVRPNTAFSDRKRLLLSRRRGAI